MNSNSLPRRPVAFVFQLSFVLLVAFACLQVRVDSAPLRRPIGPETPLWLVHIDTWNYPDPQKIIDLIPEDIRPYVVMNISLSISHNTSTSQFQVAEYGYEIARSWLRVCAENRMWAVVQHSSGGYAQFSDTDLSVYEEFFREYPNLIGFSYAEQFWGYDDPSDPISPKWTDRIAHFANLLELCNQYGGYLIVSWCGNQWSPAINPIGMVKRNPEFAEACRKYTENYLLFEKYTQTGYQLDMESICLGSYLSGYSGQYGIRYDDTGWTDPDGEHADFSMATAGAVHLEHIMLTGETMVDGPELIWTQCFKEIGTAATNDGFTTRRWDTFPQFDNVNIDLFRKVLDGTVRIPTREEVIARTKYVVVNDVNLGNVDDIYSSPETLFEGLYSFPGNLRNNKSFFKTSGRYPTIPTVFDLDGELANSFAVQVNKSDLDTRWPTIASKVNELNSVFPEEYTGDIFAGRHENAWVIYNPFKTGQTASGSIPFKYNTSERIDLVLGEYTAGVIKEYADKITIYLSNFDEYASALKTDTIKIYGSTAKPSYSFQDRGDHVASVVSEDWSGGVFTLTVQHNGPLDIDINCAGTGTGRLTDYTVATLTPPDLPMAYEGPVQYEGECFDYKNISRIQKRGQDASVRNYSGQGYLLFGTNAAAAVKDVATVRRAGQYRLKTKYSVTGADVGTIDLFVNGSKVATPNFAKTNSYSDWAIHEQILSLDEGQNTIEFRANAAAPQSVYFDSIVLVPMGYEHGNRIQENESGFVSVDGQVESVHSGYTGEGYLNSAAAAGSGINWSLNFDDSVTKSLTFRYASEVDATAELIVNGETVSTRIPFVATDSLEDWRYVTVYASVPSGSANTRLQAVSSAGLPNIDSLELVGGTQWTSEMKPFTPLGLSASPLSISEIEVTWSKAPGSDHYTVKRSTAIGGPYSVVASDVSGSSYKDTNLDELTNYYYVVSSSNVNGESADSVEASGLTDTDHAPQPPAGLAVEATGIGGVMVSWNAVQSADSYTVRRTLFSGGPYTEVASGVTDTSVSDSGLLAGLTYYYVVSASNENGESSNSVEKSTTTTTQESLEPIADAYVRDGGNVTVNFGNDANLAVKEDGNVGSGFNRRSYLKFDVHDLADAETVVLKLTPYQVDSAPNLDFKLVNDDSWSETGMTWNTEASDIGALIANKSGFVVGQSFEVDVTAAAKVEAAGDGILSIQISQPNSQGQFVGFNSKETADRALRPLLDVTLPQAVLPPQPPAGIAAEVVSDSQIDLTWSAVTNANSYHVKRSLASGGPYDTLSNTVVDAEYSDTTVSAGTSYYYVVSSIVGADESENSYEVRAVPSVSISPDEYIFATSAVVAGGRLRMTVGKSVLGHSYQLMATDRLEKADWQPVGPARSGDGSEILFEVQLDVLTKTRFFKLDVVRQ